MMIVGSLSACFFTLVSVLTDDHCIILDMTEANANVADVPNIYPQDIVTVMNTCLFAETKNAASDLGILAQIESVTALN